MIKSVAYFPFQSARNSQPVMSAMLDSLRSRGIKTEENSMHSDAVIIWSVLWAGRMLSNQAVYEHYKQQNKPVIVVDIGALYRGETWKIALDTITAEGYYGHCENLDWDRPRKLGISIAINLTHNPNIIIAAQHNSSQQVSQLPSIESWITEKITQLRLVTDRPIIVRPHPRCSLHMSVENWSNVSIEQPRKIENTYDSYNLAFDCHAMVNYNSGPGIQAALAGTRPIVDSTSLAYPVSIGLVDIDRPYTVDRDQWLVEICHTEYRVNEIQQGLWLDRLANRL